LGVNTACKKDQSEKIYQNRYCGITTYL